MSKKAKNQNALKHGAYSSEPMLPGENLSDHETLREEMCKEWAPEGITEHGLVDRLAALYWRKQRIDRYEQESLRQRLNEIEADNEVCRYLQNLKNEALAFDEATVEEVEWVFSQLSQPCVNAINNWVPREKFKDDLAKWGPAICARLSSLKPKEQLKGPAKYIALVNPDSIEMGLMRSDRIDEAIDRTIKRLMQVKTAKQIFPNMGKGRTGPRSINPAAPPDPEPVVTIDHEQTAAVPAEVEVLAEPERDSGPETINDDGSGPIDFASSGKEMPAQSDDPASPGRQRSATIAHSFDKAIEVQTEFARQAYVNLGGENIGNTGGR